MASKIRVLDEHTINKIAAGEVIESPASVIKELVENSLDAGATEICVEIKGGGRQLIRVTDNGSGMNKDDALLCLERHATSKIKEVEDIQTIFSMGFRGEAIPSIASISKFTLLTCSQEEKIGTLVLVEGGKILQAGEAVRGPGTTIEVKSLFFNVPVRRKFQKSPAIDSNEIFKVMTVLALGHPEVKFQLIDNQKVQIQTARSEQSPEDSLKERISSVLGSEFIEGCCEVRLTKFNYSLLGFIGLPSYARQNRTGQYLFINKRPVFSPLVSYLVREAYGTTLPANRHPIFVLHLSVPGEIVDVNVHPQKKEVRLRQDGVLKDLLIKGVQQALQQKEKDLHQFFVPSFEEKLLPKESFPVVNPVFSLEPKEEEWKISPLPPIQREAPKQSEKASLFFDIPVQEKRLFPRVLSTIPRYVVLDSATLINWKTVPLDALCLLDQKAAHSRIIFEKLQGKKEINVQTLLIPYSVKLTPYEASLLRLHLDQLIRFGIHIHESGPNSFMVDALPEAFGNIDVEKLIVDLLETLNEFQTAHGLEKEIEKRMALAAAKSAVNVLRRLQIEEAQSLVNQLFQCQTPFICPQGKSIVCVIHADELMKKFQKVDA